LHVVDSTILRLKVFEKGILGYIFGPKREEETKSLLRTARFVPLTKCAGDEIKKDAKCLQGFGGKI
jgi:hypothetical protein